MIKIESENRENAPLIVEINESISEFEKYMQENRKWEPLTKFEKAAISTYVFWKIQGKV